MFYVIEPQEHHFHQSSINRFVEDLQDAMIIGQHHDLTRATFLLVEEDIDGISGGILLLKQHTTTLPIKLQEYLHKYYPHFQEVWTGAVAFQMDKILDDRAFEKSSKALYRALYEDLIVFAIKENAPLLCLTMSLVEHLSIEVLGLWPCLLDVKSTESDGLFHKVLRPLGTSQETRLACKYDKGMREERVSSPDFPLLSAPKCNKIVTHQKKIKAFFRS